MIDYGKMLNFEQNINELMSQSTCDVRNDLPEQHELFFGLSMFLLIMMMSIILLFRN